MVQTHSMQTRHFAIRRLIFSNRGRGVGTASSAVRALLLLAALCVLSAPVFAAATLDLRSVSVPDLSRVVLKEMLKADYVLSPEVIASDVRLSLSLSKQSNAAIVETLRETLAASGFAMQKKGDVFYIAKALPADAALGDESAKLYTYKAKARPLGYLSKVAKFAGAQVVEGESGGMGDVLVFSASEPVLKRLNAVLAVVDTPAKAVTIRAALVEFTDTSDSGKSVALTVLSQHLRTVYKAGTALANSVTFVGGSVQAALSAIASDSRFQYLSQPMLRVLDGETAKLSVGSEVPTRGAVTLDKNGNALQSITYQSSGVILSVSPRIVGDVITLKVEQQISSFTTNTTSNIDSPSKLKREASTTIDTKKGELVALAGLDEDKQTVSHSGLSFMPAWSWSDNDNKSKSQILLLLEVLPDSEDGAS